MLAAIARLMLKRDPQAKWLKLSQGALPKTPPEALFRQGRRPLLSTVEEPDLDFAAYGLLRPVVSSRALVQPVTMKHPCALQFRLRVLLGLGMRADILCYLLTHDGGHASGIAQLLGYSQKRVQDTLIEMADSGLLLVRPSGRLKIYWLDCGQWSVFLLKKEALFPKWINWLPLARGLTTLWRGIWSVGSTQSDDYVVSSKMRTLMRQAQDDRFASGIGVEIEDDRGHIAEDYLPIFLNNMKNILRAGEQQ